MEILTPRTERAFGWIVVALVIAGLCAMLGVSSCGGPRATVAQEELQALQEQVYADGVVTPEENVLIAEALAKLGVAVKEDAENTNWGETAMSVALSLLLGGGAVRYWRGPSTKGKQ